jgi:hypothetical protein
LFFSTPALADVTIGLFLEGWSSKVERRQFWIWKIPRAQSAASTFQADI